MTHALIHGWGLILRVGLGLGVDSWGEDEMGVHNVLGEEGRGVCE
jgi:hypothetical protein